MKILFIQTEITPSKFSTEISIYNQLDKSSTYINSSNQRFIFTMQKNKINVNNISPFDITNIPNDLKFQDSQILDTTKSQDGNISRIIIPQMEEKIIKQFKRVNHLPIYKQKAKKVKLIKDNIQLLIDIIDKIN